MIDLMSDSKYKQNNGWQNNLHYLWQCKLKLNLTEHSFVSVLISFCSDFPPFPTFTTVRKYSLSCKNVWKTRSEKTSSNIHVIVMGYEGPWASAGVIWLIAIRSFDQCLWATALKNVITVDTKLMLIILRKEAAKKGVLYQVQSWSLT